MSENLFIVIISLVSIDRCISVYLNYRIEKQRADKALSISCRLMELARTEADKGNRELSKELAELSHKTRGVVLDE